MIDNKNAYFYKELQDNMNGQSELFIQCDSITFHALAKFISGVTGYKRMDVLIGDEEKTLNNFMSEGLLRTSCMITSYDTEELRSYFIKNIAKSSYQKRLQELFAEAIKSIHDYSDLSVGTSVFQPGATTTSLITL